MKKILVIAFLFSHLLISCADEATTNSTTTVAKSDTVATAVLQHPGKTWIENFRIFRDAVYHNEPAKARMFIDLAALNANKQIWYLIPDTIKGGRKPGQVFTEQDYYKYFSNLFPKEFIECILKIKTEELNTKGEFNTIEFTNSDSLHYQLYSSFDKAESKLHLNLAFKGATPVGNDEYDPVEYNYIYIFHVLPTGVLLLREIGLAG